MDTYKSKTYEIDYENNISNPSALKFNEVLKLYKDSPYTSYISNTLQATNMKWLFPSFSFVILLEMITSNKLLLKLFDYNPLYRYIFFAITAVQIVYGILFYRVGKTKKYKRTNDLLIFLFIAHFILFQCFFYLVGGMSNQAYFYFISAVIAIGLFPFLHTKFILVYTVLNYIIFITIEMFVYNGTGSLTSIFLNAFYVSFISLALSFSFFISRINLLVNNKKISLFAKEMAIANDQLNYLNTELESLSLTDTLTRIGNRRAYELEIEKIWNHALRSNTTIAIMVLDIDFFKKYNDFYGHPAGDKCISAVANCIKNCFKRKNDFVGRVGGEEFAVILSHIQPEQIDSMGERVLEAVRNLKLDHPKSTAAPYVTVSIGIASTIPSKDTSCHTLYALADKALYQAKKMGRNQFCRSSDVVEIPTEPLPINELHWQKSVIQAYALCAFYIDYVTGKVEFSSQIHEMIDIPNTTLHSLADFYSYIVPEDIPALDILVKSFFEPQFTTTSFIFRILQKDGTPLWVKCPCFLLKDDTEQPVAIVGSFVKYEEEQQNHHIVSELLDGTYTYHFATKKGTIYGKIIDQLPQKVGIDTNDLARLVSAVHGTGKNIFQSVVDEIQSHKKPFDLDFPIMTIHGNVIWLSAKNYIYCYPTGEPYLLVGSLVNLTALRYYNKHIKGELQINQITGLPDRFKFYEEFDSILEAPNAFGHLFLIDIDNFSNINNVFNYGIGNQFLKELGRILNTNKLFFGKVYHFDGDLFVLIFPNLTPEQAVHQMEHFKNISLEPVIYQDIRYQFSLSIACIAYPTFGTTSDELMRNGDIVLHKVKTEGKNNGLFFSNELHTENQQRLQLEKELRESVENNMEGFMLYYHPLVSAKESICIGAEALLRWRSSDGTILLPNTFIPILEECNLMNRVGDWVLKTASLQCKKWLKAGIVSQNKNNPILIDEHFFMSINISAHQLVEDFFQENFLSFLENIGLSTAHIVLELTESALILDMQKGIRVLASLRKQGVRIAIDDFGTGYSSLSYFRDLPVDEIKIDRSFIRDIENDHFSKEFVNSIIKITQSIDRVICVEGVETESQKQILKDFNANILQGFLFSKPIPEQEFEDLFLRANISYAQ